MIVRPRRLVLRGGGACVDDDVRDPVKPLQTALLLVLNSWESDGAECSWERQGQQTFTTSGDAASPAS